MVVRLTPQLQDRIDALDNYLGYNPTVTNAARTDQDQASLISRGYHPATNSLHLFSSGARALDLTPPAGVSMGTLFGDLKNSPFHFQELLNEGDHIHVGFPDLGGIFGSAGDAVSGIINGTIEGATGATDGIAAGVGNFFKTPVDFLNNFFSFNTGERLLAIIIGTILFLLAIYVLISRTQVYKDTVSTVQKVAAVAAV